MASADAPKTTTEPDWTEQVTHLVVDVVDNVRDKTTGPVLTIARGVVYGTIALIVLFPVAILGFIFLGRALAQLPIAEWISYLALGMLLTVVGFLAWSRRFP